MDKVSFPGPGVESGEEELSGMDFPSPSGLSLPAQDICPTAGAVLRVLMFLWARDIFFRSYLFEVSRHLEIMNTHISIHGILVLTIHKTAPAE